MSTPIIGENSEDASVLINSRIEEVTRSRSSPNLNTQRQSLLQSQVSTCTGVAISPDFPRNNSGEGEIASILNRVSSPVSTDKITSDLMEEMKTKGKRSLVHITPSHFLSTAVGSNNATNTSLNEECKDITATPPNLVSLSGSISGVRLRASAFGEVLKSPSKNSLVSDDPDRSLTELKPINKFTATSSINNKQRPKSLVEILGAKFEMGCTDIPLEDNGDEAKEIKNNESFLRSINVGEFQSNREDVKSVATRAKIYSSCFPTSISSSNNSKRSSKT